MIGWNVYGWRKRFGKFTFAIINNAGHFVPTDKPNEYLNLFN